MRHAIDNKCICVKKLFFVVVLFQSQDLKKDASDRQVPNKTPDSHFDYFLSFQ